MRLDEVLAAAKEFERAGAWDEALACYERALGSLTRDSEPATAADVLRWIGTVRRERGELELAREVYDVSLTIAELNGLAAQTASVLNCMGIVEHLRGHVREAESLYARALEQAVALHNHRLAAMLDQNLGALQALRGDLHEALRSYESARERSGRLEDGSTTVRALSNMGMTHLRLGDLVRAERCLGEALALAEAAGDNPMIGTLELNRAGLHFQAGRLEAARTCCDRALDLFVKLRSKQWSAEAYKFSGVLHREMGEPDRADASFTIALGLAEVAQNRLLQAETQMEWAVVHLRAGRHEDGISYLNQSLHLFTEMSAHREVLDIRERLQKVENLYLPAVGEWSGELMRRTGAGHAEHATRVADLSFRLARSMGIEGWELTVIRVGALIHDIGYTALAADGDEPGVGPRAHPLLKVHAIAGDAIARRVNFSREVRSIVRSHHERLDGTGFPDGLAGEQIPRATRIVSVADAFDRLANPPGGGRRISSAEALRRLEAWTGSWLDPVVVEHLSNLILDEVAALAAA